MLSLMIKRSPFVTSGIRLGTPAVTTRGLNQEDMENIGLWIVQALKNPQCETTLKKITSHVRNLCARYPLD